MPDQTPSSSIDRDRLAQTAQPPGLLSSYAGRYQPKTPDAGVSRFAYRMPNSPTGFGTGANPAYTAYNQGAR